MMRGDVYVGFCALFEGETLFFEGANDLSPCFGGDEDVVGEVGCDEEDGAEEYLVWVRVHIR